MDLSPGDSVSLLLLGRDEPVEVECSVSSAGVPRVQMRPRHFCCIEPIGPSVTPRPVEWLRHRLMWLAAAMGERALVALVEMAERIGK